MRYLISIPLLLLLGGCADMGYYWHSARGHLEVMDKRVAIEDLLAEQSTTPELRERLTLVREIREFSVTRLDLPDNDSYLSYVELDRPYLVQNLFAAPEFSTRLRQWCYPIIGCASYRGYYDERSRGTRRQGIGLLDAGLVRRPGAEQLHQLAGLPARGPAVSRTYSPADLYRRRYDLQRIPRLGGAAGRHRAVAAVA
jgi:hypothetical protein